MKRLGKRQRLLAGAVAWVLMILGLAVLLAAGAPARAEGVPTPSVPDWVAQLLEHGPAPSSASDLVVKKRAETGSGDNSIVYEGQFITYTLTVSNPGTATADDVLLLDVLPEGTLSSVGCSHTCGRDVVTQEIPGPLGDIVVVTVTRQVSWTINSLQANESVSRQFWGRVIGQPDGTVFSNRAFINYSQGGVSKSALSNDLETTVRVRIAQEGKASLSNAATWFSDDYGGTLSLAWGDFDRDGYLDLALGSTIGTTVYRNDHGRLVEFWGNDLLTYGVAWADFDNDGQLELVAVGDTVSQGAKAGRNYIYERNGTAFQGTEFASDEQLVRAAPGDFDGDGFVDLVVAANSFNVACPVQVYHNTQDPAAPFGPSGDCVSTEASAALGPVDFSNDGQLDLAIGRFPNETDLLINSGAPLTVANGFVVDQYASFLPYDFSWGDYDRDGYLDLAAAFPLDRRVRIYHNEAGAGLQLFREILTQQFRTPLSVDWGDFNGDGRLDLAVADAPPRIYSYTGSGFAEVMALPSDAVEGEVWTMRAGDQDNDGDLDLALTNRDGPSSLFSNFAPLLSPALAPVPSSGSSEAGSVAWGDTNGDGYLDLLLGAGPKAVATKLYLNDAGTFPLATMVPYYASGFGPHTVALGDVTGDGNLDLAIGLETLTAVQLYYSGVTAAPSWSSSPPHYGTYSLAFGDADSDGDLDLLVGNDGPNALYFNSGAQLATTPGWRSVYSDVTHSVAWGDVDGDGYLDFAVGNYGQPNRVYRNNLDGSFSEVWTSAYYSDTTSVAWADFDADGDLDLAVGNYGQPSLLYRNLGHGLSTTPAWRSLAPDRTTSLAWGDWNNDGYLDLAVGNDGQPDRVYANLKSRPGTPPQLYWLWTSSESYETTGLAWGDLDADGDLDLAVSRKGAGQNGVYYNNYALPSHLADQFAPTIPLPHNSPYVWVEKPGASQAAYFYHSSGLLSGPEYPTVTIQYRLYDGDGSRDDSVASSNAPGVEIATTIYEFSLDGGATWQPATPLGAQVAATTTTRLGAEATFLWDAVTDAAISDDARFRVTIVPDEPLGPVQRSAISGISPPFRVRATTCIWPRDPFILVDNANPQPGESVRFEGGVVEGSGILSYTWDFGDGATDQGQVVHHAFDRDATHVIRMTVTSEPCPIPGSVVTTRTLVIGAGSPRIFLPGVYRAYAPSPTLTVALHSGPLPLPAPGRAAADPRPYPNAGWSASAPVGAEPRTALAATTPRLDVGREIRPTRRDAGPAAAGGALGVFPLTANTGGVNSSPSLNADGRRVAFWSTANLAPSGNNADGSIEIFVAEIGAVSGPTVPVTFTQISSSTGNILGGFNLEPSIDDAGQRVAFFSDRDLTGSGRNADANFEIFVADLGPMPVITQLTDTRQGSNVLPAISADGQRIAFASDLDLVPSVGNADNNQEIFVLDLVTGAFIQVSDTAAGIINDEPCLNGNGSRVAYISDGQLVLADIGVDGSVTHLPVPNPTGGTNRRPAIDGLGDGIAFMSAGDIFLAEVSGGGGIAVTRITSSTVDVVNEEPDISADGTRIAYVSDGKIMFYDTQVGVSREVQGAPNARHPSLSADGTQFAFVAGRELWMASSPRTDVGVSKASSPNPMVPGEPISYTIVVTDGGPSNVEGITVTDFIPAEILAPSWTCTASPGIGCTAGSGHVLSDVVDIQPGTAITYVVVGTLDPAALADVVNTVAVTLPQGAVDWQPGNNERTNTTAVYAQADVSVLKTAGSDPVVPGTRLTFTLAVANAGPSDARQVMVTDTLPAAVSLVRAEPAYTYASPHLVWDLGQLAPGASRALTVVVDVASSVTQTFSNTATVTSVTSDTLPGNNRSEVPVQVTPQVDLAVTKTHRPEPAVPGQSLAYTLTVTKTGPSDAVHVVVTDALPAGVQVAQATPPYSTNLAGEVIWDLGTLTGGAHTRTLTVTADILPSVTETTITNTAVVTTTTPDTDPADNRSSDPATLAPEADLAVSKTGTPPPLVSGQPLTYTLAYSNQGPSDAQNVAITDTLPPGLSFVGVVATVPPLPGPVQSGQRLVWSIPTVEPGAPGLITFTVTVADLVRNQLANRVEIGGATSDPLLANNHDAYTVTIGADLAITKTSTPKNAVPGKTLLTYLITVTNLGPSNVVSATVYDAIPSAAFKTVPTWQCTPSSAGSDCTAQGSGLISDTVTILANDNLRYVVTGTVASSATGTLSNTAAVTAPLWVSEPDLVNNRATDYNVLAPQADLQASKVVSNEQPNQNEQIVYTLTVTNAGPSDAIGVELTDLLPGDVAYVSQDASQGSYAPGTGVWSLSGNLKGGESAELRITAGVTAVPGTRVTNTVSSLVASKPPDPDPDNNTPEVVFGVNWPPVANDDSGAGFGTDEDTAFTTASVLANDSDADAGDTLTVVAVDTAATVGAVTDNGNGIFGYDPNGQFESLAAGEWETDTFTYTIDDGHGATATAVVSITIDGVNDPPLAVDDSGAGFTTDEDTAFTTANVLANDSDPDQGDTVSLVGVDTATTVGTVTDNGGGTFDYDPNGQFEYLAAGQQATDTFTYTVEDGYGATATATVSITIDGVDDPPQFTSTPLETANEGQLYSYSITATDPDAGQSLTITAPTGASWLALSQVSTRTATLDGTPSATDPITNPIVLEVSDPTLLTATQSFTIVVNMWPVAADDAASAVWDRPAVIDVVANDGDADGDSLFVAAVGTPLSGTASIGVPDTTVVYTPTHFAGTDTFTYTVSDGLLTDTATVTVRVEPFTVTIEAPPTGIVSGTAAVFTATVEFAPALPLTYTWEATEQTTVEHASVASLTDTVTFTWTDTGPQTITVTVTNGDGSAMQVSQNQVRLTATSTGHLPAGEARWIYLPLVRRGWSARAGP